MLLVAYLRHSTRPHSRPTRPVPDPIEQVGLLGSELVVGQDARSMELRELL